MIDYFRVVATFFVIAIHIVPFASIEPRLDAVLTYGLCQIAVPFFLMTTGYFVLGPYWKSSFSESEKYRQFLKKIGVLYAGAILLYAPFVWYAKKWPKNILDFLKLLLFDGTFYHLWYFPALLLGSVVVIILLRHLLWKKTFVITGILYLIGVFDILKGLEREILSHICKEAMGYSMESFCVDITSMHEPGLHSMVH